MANLGHLRRAVTKEEQHGLDLGPNCDASSGSDLLRLLDWSDEEYPRTIVRKTEAVL
jgi:hypothetical protein